jgi:hypothetical protein
MTTNHSSPRPRFLAATLVATGLAAWATPTPAGAQDTPSRLVLRIHEVKCLDETHGTNWGADEIDLAGVAVLPDGRRVKLRTLDLGQFNKGDVKRPTRDFARIDLRKGPEFPRMFQVALILAERDFDGGLGQYLAAVLDGSKLPNTKPDIIDGGTVLTMLPAATGEPTAIATSLLAVGKKAAMEWGKDDIFRPTLAKVRMHRPEALPGGVRRTPADTIDLRQFDGHYRIVYSWRLEG